MDAYSYCAETADDHGVAVKSRRYGTGTVQKLADGRWRLRLSGTDPVTGRKAQPEVRFEGSENQAHKALDRLVADRDSGKLSPTTATVGQALEAWLAHLEPDRAKSTMREHRRTVEKSINPALGDIKLSALTAHMIDGWLTEEKTGITTRKSVRAPSTVRREFSVLRAGLNQAIKWGWLSVNPADRASPPRAAQSAELHVPTPEGLKALREKAQALETPGGYLLACVIGCLLYTSDAADE